MGLEQSKAPRRVVGLRYGPEDPLPRVILKGSGPLAEEILGGRPQGEQPVVVKNEALLNALYRLPVDCHIGPALFHVVAAILAHVFALEARIEGGTHE